MAPKRTTADRRQRKAKRAGVEFVHQFLVVLTGTDPLVWRRIEVPGDYSFWDLHVAIQDAMGWLDCHLHELRVRDPHSGQERTLGIPDQDFPDEHPLVPDWKVGVTAYFTEERPLALYLYDFGDSWTHIIAYEGTTSAESSRRYPCCVSGARACPPEDVGGIHGYARFLKAMADPRHPEHRQYSDWVGGNFDPDEFAPHTVVFDDPRDRWVRAFEE